MLNKDFPFSAEGEALDSRCEELGISRNPAVKAVREELFYDRLGALTDIDLGSRFSTMDSGENMNFVAVERISEGTYRLEAESTGLTGNAYQGDLMMISYIENLGQAVLADILIPGEEEEDDESFRMRAASYLRNEAVDGNVGQYLKWAAEYEGIGETKVFPCWNGGNSVKVSILNSLNQVASEELIAAFQEYLDPDEEGLGNGMAPIGAKVTVTTASTVEISVAATITLAGGYNVDQAEAEGIAALDAFFFESAYCKNQVNYIEIGAVLLACASIDAVQNLSVNDGQTDIALGNEEIPVLSQLTLDVGV